MSIYICTSIFSILLIIFEVNSSCPLGSNQLDDQCSTYCYQVVKPLLQYVNTVKSMTQEHNELQNTIKLQAETIQNFKVQMAQQKQMSELSESHNRNQQKLIDQYEGQLTNLKLEIKSKDKEIPNLQSENVKIKALQNEVTAYTQTSSCLEKLTGIHAISVQSGQKIIVPCDSNNSAAGDGWTVIQRRKDGSVDFNRTWSEYKEGFGDLRGEFFLGLEKLHLLTQSQPHELYISLMDFANETRYAKYTNFVVGNETELYEIKELGRYSGNAGDSMKVHKNQKFSTIDKDHTTGGCTQWYKSGWWFHNCYSCNLNGIYANSDDLTPKGYIKWLAWTSNPLKFTQMMIRPIVIFV